MKPSVALAFAMTLLYPVEAVPRTPTERAGTQQFAVIVHPSTSVNDVSIVHLRRIFLGDQQFWPGGSRVVLFVHEPGAAARTIVLRQLYQMTEGEFRRYWIAKTFRDDVTTGPKIVSSSALAKKLTATIPGAIAVIPVDDVDGSVKVLTIDSKQPRDDTYPLAVSIR